MTLEELKYKKTLTGKEQLTPDEVEMLLDFEDEEYRMGNFQRVYPLKGNVDKFEKFFEVKRYQNTLLAAYLQATDQIKAKLTLPFKRISDSKV